MTTKLARKSDQHLDEALAAIVTAVKELELFLAARRNEEAASDE